MTRTQATATATKTARRPAAKADVEDAKLVGPKTPPLDLRAMLDKLRLPGVDVASLVESRRKDIQALLAANEQAWRGLEAVTRRQGEMLSAAMGGLRENVTEALGTEGTVARVGTVAAHAQAAFDKALADMKELAELSARSQQQVVDTLNKRLREGIGEVGARIGRKH
jgi:phasin family protein